MRFLDWNNNGQLGDPIDIGTSIGSGGGGGGGCCCGCGGLLSNPLALLVVIFLAPIIIPLIPIVLLVRYIIRKKKPYAYARLSTRISMSNGCFADFILIMSVVVVTILAFLFWYGISKL